MFNLLFILLFITSTFSVKSMEMVVDKDKKEKKIRKSSSFPFSGKTSTKSFNATISIPPTQQEHPFVMAAESNNAEVVTTYLKNPYFNPNIHRYKTAFRACVEQKNYDILSLLLKDPRIDTTIKKFTINQQTSNSTNNPFDEKNELSHSLIKKERQRLISKIRQNKSNDSDVVMEAKLYELQIEVFRRQTLDITTNQFCSSFKTSYLQGNVTDKMIINAIEMIKRKIEKIAQKQIVSKNDDERVEDRQLPEAAIFPFDLEFMIKKVQFILSLNDHEFINDNEKDDKKL